MKNLIKIIAITVTVTIFVSCTQKEDSVKFEKEFTVSNYWNHLGTYIKFDGEKSIKDLAKAKKFDHIYCDFEKINEPELIYKKGFEYAIDLLNFGNKFKSIEQVILQMDSFGYRPATLRELIGLPDEVIEKYEIIALGSNFEGEYPMSTASSSIIGLEKYIIDCHPDGLKHYYNDIIRFAAVKK